MKPACLLLLTPAIHGFVQRPAFGTARLQLPAPVIDRPVSTLELFLQQARKSDVVDTTTSSAIDIAPASTTEAYTVDESQLFFASRPGTSTGQMNVEKDMEVVEKEMSQTEKLMKQVKDAGTAGVVSYALWEMAFWFISVPVCVVGYKEVTGYVSL
jgi:hypothetical protein